MKLKKVTALLLATSMVLSSVSVAPVLADEEIVDFGVEYQSEDNASEEVANFGGDLVEEEAADGEDAGDDVSFSDEIIEDDTVVEDEYVEDVADAGADLAFVDETAEPVVQEDVASVEEDLSDYINEMSLGESLDEQVADADADYADVSVTVTPTIVTPGTNLIYYGDDLAKYPVYRFINAKYYDANGKDVTTAYTGGSITEKHILLTYTPAVTTDELADGPVPTLDFNYTPGDPVKDSSNSAINYTWSVKTSGLSYKTKDGATTYNYVAGTAAPFQLNPVDLTLEMVNQTDVYVPSQGSYTFDGGTLKGILGTDEVYVANYEVKNSAGNAITGSPFAHGTSITATAADTYTVKPTDTPTGAFLGGAKAGNYNLLNNTASATWTILPDMSTSQTYTAKKEHTINGPTDGSFLYADGDATATAWKYADGAGVTIGTAPASDSDWSETPPTYKDAGYHVVLIRKFNTTTKAYETFVPATGSYAICEIKKAVVTATLEEDIETTYGTAPAQLTLDKYKFTLLESDKSTGFGFSSRPWYVGISVPGALTNVKSITYTDMTGKSTKLTTGKGSGDWPTAAAGTYKYELDTKFQERAVANQLVRDTVLNNYNIIVSEFTVVVKPYELTVKWAAKDKFEYTGKEQSYAGPDATPVTTSTPTKYYYTGVNGDIVWADVYNPAKTDVGTYTAEIKGIYLNTSARTSTTYTDAPKYTDANKALNYTIKEESLKHDWTITGGKVYMVVEPKKLSSVAYGSDDPAEKFTVEDIKVYWAETSPDYVQNVSGHKKDDEVQDDSYKLVSGDLKFATTYTKGNDVGTYNVTVSGAEAKNYTVTEVKQGTFQVVPAKVTITPADVVVPYGQDPAELTYSYTDTVKGSGEAAAAEADEKAGKFKVKLSTDPAQPTAIGSYTITSTTDPATYKNITFTYGKGKYEVVKGDLKLTIDNYEGVEDGKWHGLTIDPAISSLPNGVTIYFFEDASITSVDDFKTRYLGTVTPAQWEAAKSEIKKKDAGEYTIYYFVDGPDYGLALYGSKKITLKAKEKATAEEVEKEIDEATKKDESGKYDSDKVKAAKADYDKLTDAEKKLVDPYKVKALEEAVKAVDAQDAADAKAVEDLIAALPESDKVTEADKENIEAAKKAYDDLSEDAKAKVSKDAKEKLDADVKALEKADEDEKAAQAVEDEIAALPDPEKATAADKAKADKAKADYDALTDAQKALVDPAAVEKMNAVKKAADEAAEKEKEAKEEVAALDEKVAAVKAAKNGADGKKAAEDAKDAYDKLSDDAKKLLTDEEKAAYEATQEAYKKDKTFESGEGVFRVLSNGEVTFLKPLHPENTWFVVPNQVKKNGFMYKVVKVSTKAFMGCEKATKIKIGKNVQSIGAYAFKNTPAMGKLIMLTSKLASGKVKDSFVGAGKEKGAKLTNEVPSGKSSAYDSLFKGEGGMNAGAKFTEAN